MTGLFSFALLLLLGLTSAIQIKSYPGNARTSKALIAAKYYDIEIELPAFDFVNKEHKTEEFLKVNPFGKG